MLRVISLIAVLLLSGCDSSSSDSETEQDYSGIYDLVSVDGLTLPALVDGDTFSSGTATLSTNDSFELSLTLSPNGGNQRTFSISGTYSIDGTNVSYIYNDEDEAGEVDTGTLNGDVLTLDSAGTLFAYSKR
jgi:hypothetical protein